MSAVARSVFQGVKILLRPAQFEQQVHNSYRIAATVMSKVADR